MFLHKRLKYFDLTQRHSGASEFCQVSSASRFQFVFNTCITSTLARRNFKHFFLLIWLEKVKKDSFWTEILYLKFQTEVNFYSRVVK